MTQHGSADGPSWLREWMRLERFVNDGSPNRLSFVNAPAVPISPRYGLPEVLIPLVRPRGGFTIAGLGDWQSSTILRNMCEDRCIAIHPDALPYYFETSSEGDVEICGLLTGIPTAAGRTLLVKDADSFVFLKLSFPGLLGRFASPLTKQKVEHSLRVSKEIQPVAAGHVLSERAAVILTRPCGGADIEVALIRRDSLPAGVEANSEGCMVPAFSLLAAAADFDPLLGRLVTGGGKVCGGEQAWLVDWIVRPTIQSYWTLAATGLLPEPHAQNILYWFKSLTDRPTVVWRDCQGFIFDDPTVTPVADSEVLQLRSRRYDDYLSQYVLTPMALRFATAYGCSFDAITAAARNESQSVLERWPRYFGETETWYDMRLDQPQFGQRIGMRKRRGKSVFR